MSLRAADFRFLLHRPPETAMVASPDRARSEAFERAGISLIAPDVGGSADLLIARGYASWRHARVIANSTVIEGRTLGARAFVRRGRPVDRYVVKSGSAGPVLAALATAPVRRYLATTFSRPSRTAGRLRNRILDSPLGTLTPNLLVAHQDRGVPYPIAAALPAEVAATVSGWLFSFRTGDDLQRIVALVFCHGDSRPSYVVKFGRLPGVPARAATEQEVLGELTRSAPELAGHVTVVERRGLLGGSELTVEPPGSGSVLTAYLQQAPAERSGAIAETILTWIRDLGRRTARPCDAGTARQRAALLAACGAEQLTQQLAQLPAVVAHQDLGSWNILTDGTQFTVVDWESATVAGLPLTDLFYFGTDLLAELHGPRDSHRRPAWCAALWAGSLPASDVLRRWVEQAAQDAGIPERQLGALATACWLQHGRSRDKRAALLDDSAGYGYLGEVAALWRADPRLGLDWAGFSAWPNR